MKSENCKIVEIPETQYCCSGWMCGCMGMPTEPPFCKECYSVVIENIPSKDRRNEQ